MEIENLALNDFQTTVIVVLAILSAFAVLDKGVAAIKNLFFKGGVGMEKRITVIEEKQNRDYTRLNELDRKLLRVDDDMAHILNALNAILMHEITGNSIEGMKEEKSALDTYMSKRGTSSCPQKG